MGATVGVLGLDIIGGGSFHPLPLEVGGLQPGPPWSGVYLNPVGGSRGAPDVPDILLVRVRAK